MRDVQPEFDEIYRLYAADIYRICCGSRRMKRLRQICFRIPC